MAKTFNIYEECSALATWIDYTNSSRTTFAMTDYTATNIDLNGNALITFAPPRIDLISWFTNITSYKLVVPIRRTAGSGTSTFDVYLYQWSGESSSPPSTYTSKKTVTKTFSNTTSYVNLELNFTSLNQTPDDGTFHIMLVPKDGTSFSYKIKPREITLTVDGTVKPFTLDHYPSTGVNAGENLRIYIYDRGNRKPTLVFRKNGSDTVLYTTKASGDIINVTCQESWFTAAGESSTSMIVNVRVAEYTSATDAFTLYKVTPTLTALPSPVTVGKKVTVSIGKRNGRTMSLRFKRGNTVLQTVTATSDTVSVTCPRSWFTTAGVTAHSMQVTVEAVSYNVTTTFTLNEITPWLSLTPESVSTGGKLNIQIRDRDGRTLTLRLKYGSTLLTTVTGNADTVSVTCSKSWFTTAGVSTLSSMTVNVSIDDYSSQESFTLNAGSDMKPTVGTVTTTPVQQGPASTSYPNTYLKSITKVKFAVAVTKGSNSLITNVRVALEGKNAYELSYNSSTQKYEGTFGPVTDAGYTVTVIDARHLSGTKTGNIGTIYPYTQPAITVDPSGTYRCNSSGTKTPGGSYYRAKATATIYSGLSGNAVTAFTVKLSGTSDTVNLTSGVQSAAKQTSVVAGEKMDLVFSLTDTVGYTTTRTFTLAPGGSWIDINEWSGTSAYGDSGTSVGIGLNHPGKAGLNCIDMSSGDGGLHYYGEAGYLLNGMNALAFPMLIRNESDGTSFGKNILNVNASLPLDQANATAYFKKSASDSAWSGFPTAFSGSHWYGFRFVLWFGDRIVIVVVEDSPTPGRIWSCRTTDGGSSWSSWKSITPA